jgi:hypothetical protein
MDPLKSRMPEEPRYWDALVERIATDAVPVLAESYERRGSWWGGLARGCPALAAAASVGVVAGSILIAQAPAALDDSPFVEVARAIGPSDQVAQLLLSESAPPSVESLLPVLSSGGRNR